jgi:hypothetical protein
MAVMTDGSKWPMLVGAAPVIGVAFFVWASAQGDAELARSFAARAILAAVAALGALVAWWTARRLRTASTVTVAEALALARAGQSAGLVALRGRARALHDAVPLISPDGELCLWFRQGESAGGEAVARDSLRPFLLVDDSGECIVLPAGADVSGQGPVPQAASSAMRPHCAEAPSRDRRVAERLLRNGDRIHVLGRFVPASPEALALQAETAARVARSEASQALFRGDTAPFRDLRSAAVAGAAFVAAPPLVRHGLPLPVMAAGGASQPLCIRIGTDENEGGVYGLLAVVDCLVLVVSSSMAAWSMVGASW